MLIAAQGCEFKLSRGPYGRTEAWLDVAMSAR